MNRETPSAPIVYRLVPQTDRLWPLLIGLSAAGLVFALSARGLLVVAVGLLGALLLLRYPEIALAFFLTVGAFKADPRLSALAGRVDLTIFFVLIVWISILRRVFGQRREHHIDLSLLVPVAFLVLLILLSLTYTINLTYGLDKAGRFIFLTSLGVFGPVFLLTERSAFRRFAVALAVIALGLSVSGLLAWIRNPAEMVRIFGGNYLGLGRIAGSGTMAAGYLLFTEDSLLVRVAAGAAALIGVMAVLSAGGRGPVLALAATPILAALIVTAHSGLKSSIKLVAPAVMVVLVFLVIFKLNLLPPVLQKRLALAAGPITTGARTDASFGMRFILFAVAFSAMTRAPLGGVGIGGFPVAAGPAFFMPLKTYPHNIFLELGAELGLTGLALFLVFLFLTFRRAARSFSATTASIDRTAIMTALTFLVYALMNASISGDLNDNKMVWFGAGLIFATSISAAKNTFAQQRELMLPE